MELGDNCMFYSRMACVSRPKPPSFWGQTALLVLLAVADAQVDDSLYFDPRYQFQGKADQRSLDQQFNAFNQFPQASLNAKTKPVKELNLDEALNAFLKTQDPKYYHYYRNGNSKVGDVQDSSGRSQIAALLKQIDDVGSQQCTANVLAQWNFETNVNQVTQLEAVSTLFCFHHGKVLK